MMKSLSIAKARDQLTEIIRQAEAGHAIHITRRGEAVAVLLASADYQRLMQSAASRDFADWLHNWRSQLPSGFTGITDDEIQRWQNFR